MKTIICLLAFLSLTNSIQAVNLNSDGVGHPMPYYEAPISYRSWGKNFFIHLTNSDSIETQAVGAALYYANNYQEYDEITKQLNKVLPQNLNKESLYILRHVCHELNKYKSTCKKHNYYNRLIKNDHHNLNLFIKPLLEVENSNKSELINQLIVKLNEYTHANSYDGYFLQDLKKELKTFFKLNPNPLYKPHPLFKNNNIKLSPSKKVETIINKLSQMFNQTLSNYIGYHYFLSRCDMKLTNDKSMLCKLVINILINKSDSENLNNVGYTFQTDMELANHDFTTSDYETLNNAVIARSKLKLTQNCEANPGITAHSKNMYRNYRNIYPLYLNTVIKNTKMFGLDKARSIGNLALKKYLIVNNFVNSDSFKDCSSIDALEDQEFFSMYKNNSSVKNILKNYKPKK